MGADLCIAAYEFPPGVEDSSFAQHFQELREAVDTATDEEVINAFLEARNETFGEAFDGYNKVEVVDEVRGSLLRAIDELSVPYRRRDTTFRKFHGGWVLLTGGMTWGDNPTDAYDLVDLLWAARGLLEKERR